MTTARFCVNNSSDKYCFKKTDKSIGIIVFACIIINRMDDTNQKQEVQFNSADIGKKEKPKFFSQTQKTPLKDFQKWFKQHKKLIILIASGVLVLGRVLKLR